MLDQKCALPTKFPRYVAEMAVKGRGGTGGPGGRRGNEGKFEPWHALSVRSWSES